jgi:hypothetical protein
MGIRTTETFFVARNQEIPTTYVQIETGLGQILLCLLHMNHLLDKQHDGCTSDDTIQPHLGRK